MWARLRALLGERALVLLLSFVIATALWLFVRDTARQVSLPSRPGAMVKTVPVVATVRGVPARGFAVAGLEVKPPAVTISGPVGVIDEIDVLPTDQVDVTGASADVERVVDLRVPPAVLIHGSVTVRVIVRALVARSLLRQVAVLIEGVAPRQRADLDPAAIEVEVEGAPEIVAGLRPSDLRVVVDLTGKTPGTYRLPVHVTAPRAVRVVALRPAEISVLILRI